MFDMLHHELRRLSESLAVPEPSPGLAGAVLARATSAPLRRRRGVRWAAVGAVVVGLLGLAGSPVGARMVAWLDFHGVMVRDAGGAPSGTPVVPSESPGSFEGAAFRPLLPTALGPPDGVSISPDGRLVSLTWTQAGETIRVDEFEGELAAFFWKTSPDARLVEVAGRHALWFPEPHEVVVVPAGGTPETHGPRLAGKTLVVPWGEVTVRLEGDLDLDRAIAIVSTLA